MVGMHFLFFYFQLVSNYKVLLSWHEHLHSFVKRHISDRTIHSPMVLKLYFFHPQTCMGRSKRWCRREKLCHLWYCNNDFLSTLGSCSFQHWTTQQCLMHSNSTIFTESRTEKIFPSSLSSIQRLIQAQVHVLSFLHFFPSRPTCMKCWASSVLHVITRSWESPQLHWFQPFFWSVCYRNPE